MEQYGQVSRLDSEDEEARVQNPNQHHEEEGEEFDFAEIFVHQVCHSDILKAFLWQE